MKDIHRVKDPRLKVLSQTGPGGKADAKQWRAGAMNVSIKHVP